MRPRQGHWTVNRAFTYTHHRITFDVLKEGTISPTSQLDHNFVSSHRDAAHLFALIQDSEMEPSRPEQRKR